MTVRRGNFGVMAVFAVACLVMNGSQAAQAQVKLEYKFPEGTKLTYRTNWNPSQTLNLAGQEIQSRERKTVVWTQAAGKRRGDSTLPVDVKVESLRSELRLQGGIDLKFDSSKPDARFGESDFAPLADLYKLESQVAYTVLLDGQNKVKAVEGTGNLEEKASKLDAIARAQILGRIAADRLKAQFEQEHRNLPDGPVKPGESWDRTEIVEYGGPPLSIRKKYEYAGTEKRGDKTLDKITSKVLEVKCPPQDAKTPSPLKVTKSDLKVESSEGTLLFDREAGCLVESHTRIKLKGNMTFSGDGTDTSTPIDLNLQSDTRLQAPAK